MLLEELTKIHSNVEPSLFEDMLTIIWERIILPQFERHVAGRPAKIKNYYDILQVHLLLPHWFHFKICEELQYRMSGEIQFPVEMYKCIITNECNYDLWPNVHFFVSRTVSRMSPSSLYQKWVRWITWSLRVSDTTNSFTFFKTSPSLSKTSCSGENSK